MQGHIKNVLLYRSFLKDYFDLETDSYTALIKSGWFLNAWKCNSELRSNSFPNFVELFFFKIPLAPLRHILHSGKGLNSTEVTTLAGKLPLNRQRSLPFKSLPTHYAVTGILWKFSAIQQSSSSVSDQYTSDFSVSVCLSVCLFIYSHVLTLA